MTRRWLWWCAALAFATIVWFVFAYAVAPNLVESAYAGDSIPALNQLIERQSVIRLDYYLAKWAAIANRCSVAVVVIAVAMAALGHPTVRARQTATRGFIALLLAGVAIGAGPPLWSKARAYLNQVALFREADNSLYTWRYEHTRFPDVDRNLIGDGAPALEIELRHPHGLAEDLGGRVYIADRSHIIWRVDPDGRAHIVAGTGRAGPSEEVDDARQSSLGIPEGLCIDAAGRVHFADSRNNKVLRIDTDGRLVRVAGTGKRGDSGDGGPAREADLNRPFDVDCGSDGVLFIADYGNERIRSVDPDGSIRAFAGTGVAGYEGDGGPAANARFDEPYGQFLDASGRLIITDSGNHVLRRVDDDGNISTVAGVGEAGFSGDGGPSRLARFNAPQGGRADADGRLYVNDEHNHAIRMLETDGTIRTIAGTGRLARDPNGALAANTALADPEDVLVRADGSILVSEAVPENLCEWLGGDQAHLGLCAGLVRRIDPDGTMHTFAGKAEFPPSPESER